MFKIYLCVLIFFIFSVGHANSDIDNQVAFEKITNLAAKSSCAEYSWKNRGKAKKGYIKGMALVFARSLCNQERSDVILISKAKTGSFTHDILTWYEPIFWYEGLYKKAEDYDVEGIARLRDVYTLLIGLGMRESSGKHCTGRDSTATNTSAETAEAGLFQTSYNSRRASVELPKIISRYTSDSACLLDVFKEGVVCDEADWENWGAGEGKEFQRLSKECPAFATEYAAVTVRVLGGSKGHYGPLRRFDAEVKPQCSDMLKGVQKIIQDNPEVCQLLE